MSLLSLFSNVVWRGNGAPERLKRSVAASLVSRNNAPQPLQDLSGLAPAAGVDIVGFTECLETDPCFQVDRIHGCVHLELSELFRQAKTSLFAWIDQAIPPQSPHDYLKNCLGKHIVKEQEAQINAPSTSLFTIERVHADAMLDAFWTDGHPWHGTISPAQDSLEDLFAGDALWSLQPGGSIKLNIAAVMQRAGSPRLAAGPGGKSSELGPPLAWNSRVDPHPVAPPPSWSNGGVAAVPDSGPGLSGPPPDMLPRPALFAAAAADTGATTLANGIDDDGVGAEHSRSGRGVGLGVDANNNLLDLANGTGLGGFSRGFGEGLGLRWSSHERLADSSAAGTVGMVMLGGIDSGGDGPAALACGPPGNMYDPVEAAVEEVAAHVALEALGDSEVASPGGVAAAPGKGLPAPGGAAGSALEAGPRAGSQPHAAFGGGRGWELFPSAGHGASGSRNALGAEASAAGAGDGDNAGNMSLLDELYMAFAPTGVGGGGSGAAAAASSSLAGSRRGVGDADLPSLGGLGGGQWGAAWVGVEDSRPKEDGGAPNMASSANLLTDGQLPRRPSEGANASSDANGLAATGAAVEQTLSTPLLHGFGLPPIGEAQPTLYGHGSSSAAALPSFAPSLGAGLSSVPFGGARAPAVHPFQDPAILNAGSAHPVGQAPSLGPLGAGSAGSGGHAGVGASLFPLDRSERQREPRVVPFQPPPPPLSLTRGALALANVGPPAVLPAAAMHGFDVAAAAAAAAGRGVVGAQAPVALGMMPAAAPNAAAASGGSGAALFPLPDSQQPAGGAGMRREEVLHAAAPASASSRAPSMAGGPDGGAPTAAECAAAAARVWPADGPKNAVRRIAASLLALAGQGASTGPHSMAWEPLLLAVRRQDPVACNRAGDLLAVLDEDPTQCLSVTEAEGGGSEVVRLELPRMLSLAGSPPAAATVAPTAPSNARHSSSLHRQPSFGASSTASTPHELAQAGGSALSSAWLQASGADADPSRRPPRPQPLPGAAPAAVGSGWPLGSAPLTPAVLASATAAHGQHPLPATGQQQAFAAAAAAAAAMQAMQTAHGQPRSQHVSLLAGAPPGATVPAASAAAAPTQALLMQLLQQQQRSGIQQPQLGGLAHAGLLGAGVQDPPVLLQLLQAQQQQHQVQQLRLAQQAQQAQQLQAQQLQALLQRQAAAQQAQQAQQLFQKQQQMQQLQQLMLLEQQQRRPPPQQQTGQAQAQAQLTPMIPILPVPPPSQTAALANLLQQFSAGSANHATEAVRPAIPPLPLAALPNAGNLLNAVGSLGQSQSHANVAAWLAAHSQSRGATPPPQAGADAAQGQQQSRGSQHGDAADAAPSVGTVTAQDQQRQQMLQALLASVPQSASQQQKLMEVLAAQTARRSEEETRSQLAARRLSGGPDAAVEAGLAAEAPTLEAAGARRKSKQGHTLAAEAGSAGAAVTEASVQGGVITALLPSQQLTGLGSSANLGKATGDKAATAYAREAADVQSTDAVGGAAEQHGRDAADQPEIAATAATNSGRPPEPPGPAPAAPGPIPSLSLQLQLLASATAARRAEADAASTSGAAAAAVARASGALLAASASAMQPSPARSAPAISPAHLLLAFPGLDTRAKALRTIAQVLLHSRHPQLGAAATDPGLLLLVLRQKGIIEAAPDASSLSLLTSLLLSEPRFFRIVPPAEVAGSTSASSHVAAGGVLGGGAAVQLLVDALQALLPPEGQDGEAEAESPGGAAGDSGAAQDGGVAAPAEPSVEVVASAAAAGAPEAAAAAAADVAQSAEATPHANAVQVDAAALSDATEASPASAAIAPGAAAGASRSPEADGEGEEEQSDEAHLAMLMRLLATGARLEEEPLPDSPAQLQRQLSPLLERVPPMAALATDVAAAPSQALAPANAELADAAVPAPSEAQLPSELVVPIPIPVPALTPAGQAQPVAEEVGSLLASAADRAPVASDTADKAVDVHPLAADAGAATAANTEDVQAAASQVDAGVAPGVESAPAAPGDTSNAAAAADPAAHDRRPSDVAEPTAMETRSATGTGSLGCPSEMTAEELWLPVPPPVGASGVEPVVPHVDEAPATVQAEAVELQGAPAADSPQKGDAASAETVAVSTTTTTSVESALDADEKSMAAAAPEEAGAPSVAASSETPVDASSRSGAAAVAPGPSPSAAHMQPAAVRYISGLDVEAGCADEVGALATLEQHCAAARRIVVDCAVAELLEGEPGGAPVSAAQLSPVAHEGDLEGSPASPNAELSGGPTPVEDAAKEANEDVTPAAGATCGALVLVALLAPAAQAWPTTLYVLGVAGVPHSSRLVRAAAALLAGPGSAVKVVWNAAQVLSALSSLLPQGARVAPTQDLRTLVSLATAGAAATAAAGAPEVQEAAAPTPRAPRPWSGMVALQERLAQLGVAGRDLASLAALGADAWVVHPLSCVVEAAAARQLCAVLEARRDLLFGEETLLDALLCAASERLAAA